MFFKRLYQSLPLQVFLPPGEELANNSRRALMQRINIMASKLLIDQMITDLHELVVLDNHNDFSREEYAIIWQLIYGEYYSGLIDVYRYADYFDEVRELSKTSKVIRMLRREMTRALITRFRRQPGPAGAVGLARLLSRLFLLRPGLSGLARRA
jgi:hypothetical protein